MVAWTHNQRKALATDYDAAVGGVIVTAFDVAANDPAFADITHVDVDAAATGDDEHFDVELSLKAKLTVRRYPSPRATASEVLLAFGRWFNRADAEVPYVEPAEQLPRYGCPGGSPGHLLMEADLDAAVKEQTVCPRK